MNPEASRRNNNKMRNTHAKRNKKTKKQKQQNAENYCLHRLE